MTSPSAVSVAERRSKAIPRRKKLGHKLNIFGGQLCSVQNTREDIPACSNEAFKSGLEGREDKRGESGTKETGVVEEM
ncbi:hypothetical protein FRC07_009078, partial [Ceratobasidium sp. 392]